jgi:hypothetical protein
VPRQREARRRCADAAVSVSFWDMQRGLSSAEAAAPMVGVACGCEYRKKYRVSSLAEERYAISSAERAVAGRARGFSVSRGGVRGVPVPRVPGGSPQGPRRDERGILGGGIATHDSHSPPFHNRTKDCSTNSPCALQVLGAYLEDAVLRPA